MLTFVSRVRYMLYDLEADLLFTKKGIMLHYPLYIAHCYFFILSSIENVPSHTNPTIPFQYQHPLNLPLATGRLN